MTVIVSQTAAWAQSPAAVSFLPIGSPLTIILDETVDARVRAGADFRAHLRDPLTLGDTLVATAGTPARLVVTARDIGKDGGTSYRIAIVGLNLGLAGTLPVRPVTPAVERITAGMAIPVTTLAALGFEAGKVRVAVPLPFKLSNDPPNGGYTPAPLRTAAPVINRRRSTPTPSPSAAPSPSPSAAASSAPASTRSSSRPTSGGTPAPLPAPT